VLIAQVEREFVDIRDDSMQGAQFSNMVQIRSLLASLFLETRVRLFLILRLRSLSGNGGGPDKTIKAWRGGLLLVGEAIAARLSRTLTRARSFTSFRMTNGVTAVRDTAVSWRGDYR
jgi:hypothetical protein